VRMGVSKDGPVISDNGNFIIDADFGKIDDPVSLNKELSYVRNRGTWYIHQCRCSIYREKRWTVEIIGS